jgi:hypothetical protein
MSKPAVLETLDTQKVTKAVTDALPNMELLTDAKKREERLNKAIRTFSGRAPASVRAWWRNLPNDGVRIAIPLTATMLVAGFITGLVVGYARRH